MPVVPRYDTSAWRGQPNGSGYGVGLAAGQAVIPHGSTDRYFDADEAVARKRP